MNIIDRIKQAIKQGAQEDGPYPTIREICKDFGIVYSNLTEESDDIFGERFKTYHIDTWICTDELAGVIGHYFDGEIVGVSCRNGRKDYWRTSWTSIEAAVKVRDFIMTLPTETSIFGGINILDSKQEYKDYCEANRMYYIEVE